MAQCKETRLPQAGMFAYACSVRGAAHVRADKPCQDDHTVAVTASGELLIAVADGHGDERHDLSAHGAACAVGAALAELQGLLRELEAQRARGESGGALLNSFRLDFPRHAQRRWQAAVRADADQRRLAIPKEADEQRAFFSRYGTTLLVAAVDGDSLLLGQIGDGDLLIVTPEGVESPMPRSEELIGNAVYSMSSPDAARLWVTATVARPPRGLLLAATDGLSNCFADDANFHRFAASLLERMTEYSPKQVAREVPGWLEHYSQQGSGDDITLALVLWGELDLRKAATPSHEASSHTVEEEHDESASGTGDSRGTSEPEVPRQAEAR